MTERKRKWDQPAEGSPNTKARLEMSPTSGGADDAGAAAAAIAARIAAQYGGSGGGAAPSRSSEGPKYEKDKPELNDPEFVKDIDINDVRNRYLLTKGPTQVEVHQETGCSVTTKGQWYPDRNMATDRDPPLYLHLTATSQEILDKGIAKINELMDQDLGPLTEQRRDRREPRERLKWPEHKVPIELENLRNFNVRAKVVGPGGLFVKHIQSETGCRVQIKGLGSGFIETETGAEAPEPMHINVAGPDEAMNAKAKELAEDLLAVVKEKWMEAQAVNQQHQGGYNAPQGYGGYGGYGQQPAGGYPGYAAPPPGGAPPPPPSEAPPLPPGEAPPAPPSSAAPGQTPAGGTQDYSAYYQQYYGQQAGGQQAAQMTPEQQAYYNSPEYKAWYQQYLASYQQQQAGQTPVPGQAQPQPPAATGAAPPPPTEAAPPPPPPPA